MEDDFDMTNYINRLRTIHHRALLNFKLYQKLMIARSPKHVGDLEANNNMDVINKYAGVFIIVVSSTRYTFLMSLAVLFTPGKDKLGDPSISLTDLLFRINRLGDKSQEQIKILHKVQREVKDNQSKIDIVKSWRNQQLAHLDLNPDIVNISDKDLIRLTELSTRIIALAEWCFLYIDLSLCQYQHNAGSHIYAESEVDMDFENLFNKLLS